MSDELPSHSTTGPDDNSPQGATSLGGVHLDAERDVNIGGDVVGRDKIITAGDDVVMGDQVEAGTYIEHATIVQDRTNRVWLAALAGVVGLIAIALGVVAARPSTAPAPVLTVVIPTDQPTAAPPPNTPTPTATPIFAGDMPYRVAIARFNQLSDRKFAIEQRLQDDLDQQLQAAGLSDEVDVKVVAQPAVESAEDAQKLAEATRSSVVIWGLYDDVGIRLRVSLGSNTSLSQAVSEVARFGELPLTSTGSETSTLSFYVTSTLPANTSFLSFYVLGHLYYLSNQYAKGHAAFNTAMSRLPQTVAVENEALLHFFNARAVTTTDLDGAIEAICEYASAIAIDPQMFEAYNNIGALVVKYEHPFSFGMPAEQRKPLDACAGKAGIVLNARELFSDALRINPTLGIARYNLGMLDWNTKAQSCMSGFDCEGNPEISRQMLESREQAANRFLEAVKLDPSIPGAHLGLGNLAVWRGDYVSATTHYSAALAVLSQSPEAAVNLGHALALQERFREAEAAYRQALRVTPENGLPYMEAHLALGLLYDQQQDPARARQEYERVQQAQASAPEFSPDSLLYSEPAHYYAVRALQLALAQSEIEAGQWVSASQRLSQLPQNALDSRVPSLDSYLVWLIDTAHGVTTTLSAGAAYTVTDDYPTAPFVEWSYGNASAMAWYDLVQRCKTSAVDDFRTWGGAANPCLPLDPRARLDEVFKIVQRRMQQRLFYNDVVPVGGMACPYIFTFDDHYNEWLFDTTILYKLVGPQAETTQARRLSRFTGQLLLREVEPETSYVDMVAVRLITADGREITLQLNDPLLGADDGRYLVLRQGDQHLLTFDVPAGALPAREAWVVAAGYYVPFPHD